MTETLVGVSPPSSKNPADPPSAEALAACRYRRLLTGSEADWTRNLDSNSPGLDSGQGLSVVGPGDGTAVTERERLLRSRPTNNRV
jgi:hypothetical protein